jgi:hypothetical protein
VPVATPPGPWSRGPRCPGTHRLRSVRHRAGRGAAAPCRSDGVVHDPASHPGASRPGGSPPGAGRAAMWRPGRRRRPSRARPHPGAGRPVAGSGRHDRCPGVREHRSSAGIPAAALRRATGPRDPVPAGGPARRIRRSGGSVLPDELTGTVRTERTGTATAGDREMDCDPIVTSAGAASSLLGRDVFIPADGKTVRGRARGRPPSRARRCGT